MQNRKEYLTEAYKQLNDTEEGDEFADSFSRHEIFKIVFSYLHELRS